MLHNMSQQTDTLAEGKVPPPILSRLLFSTSSAPQIIVGAEAGEDAAVVKGSERIVITADPITFTEENIGTYTVAVNCNDIVAMGGEPVYLTTTILLPPGTTQKRLEIIFQEIRVSCRKAEILWVGGHTEVTPAVTRIIVSAQAVGFLHKEPTLTSDAKPGHLIVMTKWAGLEGTTLIARERPQETSKLLGAGAYQEVLGWLDDPGISILREGKILHSFPLGAAHDPTEGGVSTGVHEIASRSRLGVRIDWEKIPIREETALLCKHFSLDPLGVLSSGVFLFTSPPAPARKACRALTGQGIPAAIIGEMIGPAGEVILTKEGKCSPLPIFIRDELIKLKS